MNEKKARQLTIITITIAATTAVVLAAIKTAINTGFNWIKTRKSKQEKKPQVLQESGTERPRKRERGRERKIVAATAGVWLSVTAANNYARGNGEIDKHKTDDVWCCVSLSLTHSLCPAIACSRICAPYSIQLKFCVILLACKIICVSRSWNLNCTNNKLK